VSHRGQRGLDKLDHPVTKLDHPGHLPHRGQRGLDKLDHPGHLRPIVRVVSTSSTTR